MSLNAFQENHLQALSLLKKLRTADDEEIPAINREFQRLNSEFVQLTKEAQH